MADSQKIMKSIDDAITKLLTDLAKINISNEKEAVLEYVLIKIKNRFNWYVDEQESKDAIINKLKQRNGFTSEDKKMKKRAEATTTNQVNEQLSIYLTRTPLQLLNDTKPVRKSPKEEKNVPKLANISVINASTSMAAQECVTPVADQSTDERKRAINSPVINAGTSTAAQKCVTPVADQSTDQKECAINTPVVEKEEVDPEQSHRNLIYSKNLCIFDIPLPRLGEDDEKCMKTQFMAICESVGRSLKENDIVEIRRSGPKHTVIVTLINSTIADLILQENHKQVKPHSTQMYRDMLNEASKAKSKKDIHSFRYSTSRDRLMIKEKRNSEEKEFKSLTTLVNFLEKISDSRTNGVKRCVDSNEHGTTKYQRNKY